MQVNDRNRNARNIGWLAAISLFLHLGIAPSITLAQGHPNFLFIFMGVVALSIGGRTGVLTGFAAGVVFDLCSTGPFGLGAMLFPISAFFLGMEVRDRIAEEPVMTIIPFSLASLSVSLLYNISMLIYGATGSFVEAVFYRGLPVAVLTTLFYVPYLLVLSHIHGGGMQKGATGRHRARYTLGTR